jgi:adenylate cyclase
VDLGYGMADLLLTDLAQVKSLHVIDRIRTDALLHELSVADPGTADSTTSMRVSRLLGARTLVLGALAFDAARALRIDARVADAQQGTITGSLPMVAPVDRLIAAQKQMAFRIIDLLGIVLTPAEREAVERAPTRSVAALLAYSRGVRAEAERDFARAAAEYTRALRADPGFVTAHRNLGTLRGKAEAAPGLARAAGLALDNVNQLQSAIERSAADAPITAAVSPVTVTVRVRVP